MINKMKKKKKLIWNKIYLSKLEFNFRKSEKNDSLPQKDETKVQEQELEGEKAKNLQDKEQEDVKKLEGDEKQKDSKNSVQPFESLKAKKRDSEIRILSISSYNK